MPIDWIILLSIRPVGTAVLFWQKWRDTFIASIDYIILHPCVQLVLRRCGRDAAAVVEAPDSPV